MSLFGFVGSQIIHFRACKQYIMVIRIEAFLVWCLFFKRHMATLLYCMYISCAFPVLHCRWYCYMVADHRLPRHSNIAEGVCTAQIRPSSHPLLDRPCCRLNLSVTRSLCTRFRRCTSKSSTTLPGDVVYTLPGQSLHLMRGANTIRVFSGATSPG